MSNEQIFDFNVSTIFQKRLAQAFAGDDRSNVEIAKDIGISKDVFIRSLKTGLLPSTRSIIKIADYLEMSVDYLIGVSDNNTPCKTIDGMLFFDRLEQLKEKADKKYGTIATDIGIARSLFNSWKNNKYVPNLEICYQLALYFEVSIDYLLARE